MIYRTWTVQACLTTIMKFPSLKSLMLGLFSVATANAAKSFSASNLYYAAGLTDGQQTTLLNGLQSAGVKVLRVWLGGKRLSLESQRERQDAS